MRWLSALAVAACVLGVVVSVATAAGGGGSIADAPVVPPGVQQFGNTSTFTDDCDNGYEYWVLQLKRGDLAKITWGGPPAVDHLALWPPGTSDSDSGGCLLAYSDCWGCAWDVDPVLSATNGTPSTTRLDKVRVTKSGNYPLLLLNFYDLDNAGPYSFTVVVLHGASVFLPRISRLAEKGKLTAVVLAPDSSPISDSSLHLTLNGIWKDISTAPARRHALGTATPVNGKATFTYKLPRKLKGRTIGLRVTGGGSDYQSVTSQTENVQVR